MTRAAVRWLAGVGILALAACGPAADPPALLLRGVRVIDGTGAPPTESVTVIVRDGWIEGVAADSSVRPARGDRVIDLAGRTVIPGFVDLHVHFPPDSSVQEAMLHRLAEWGVTTVLNPGARVGSGVELRDRRAIGSPRIRTAGLILENAEGREGPLDWAVLVTDTAEVRGAVRSQLDAGVDFVKLYAGLGPDLVAAAVAEARTADVPVILHAGATGWRRAAELGVDMLVHAGYSSPMEELMDVPDPAPLSDPDWYAAYARAPEGRPFADVARTLMEREVVIVPTLSIMQAAAFADDLDLLASLLPELAPERDLPGWWGEGWERLHPQRGEVSDEEAALLKEVYWPALLDIHRAWWEAGVEMGVGTDVGNPWMTPGVSFHHELALYAEAGIPPLEVLAMATRNGGRALGLEEEIGVVAPGFRADLVVLTDDPSTDIAATRSIELVLVDGRVVVDRR